LIDVSFATYATFFDGLLSRDSKANSIFTVGSQMLNVVSSGIRKAAVARRSKETQRRLGHALSFRRRLRGLQKASISKEKALGRQGLLKNKLLIWLWSGIGLIYI